MVRRRQLFEGDQMRIVLADEISPDNCRLWDAKTDEKLNIDRFRRDMDMIAEGYQEVTRHLGILPENSEPDVSGPRLVK